MRTLRRVLARCAGEVLQMLEDNWHLVRFWPH